MLVIGCFLPEETRKDILRRFVNRATREVARATGFAGISKTLLTDKEWLAEYAFHVKKDLSLDKRCPYAEPCYTADCVPIEARLAGLVDNTPPLIVADRLDELSIYDDGSPIANKIRAHYKPYMMVQS